MLKIFEKNSSLLEDAWLISAAPVHNFKDWLLVFEPMAKLDTSSENGDVQYDISIRPKVDGDTVRPDYVHSSHPVDEQTRKEVRVVLRECIYIDFKGFKYQTTDKLVLVSIMGWTEIEDSELLRKYFSDKPDHAGFGKQAYTPGEMDAHKMDQFHHINFMSFDVDIDVLCKDVEVI